MSTNPASLSLHHHHHRRRRHDQQQQQQRERMFEKTLTPSDVGKLNRLVIPKQHAERYFPLGGGGGGGGGGGDKVVKDLALGFEDEAGKLWRFRYSYWSSSQSYVLTKGWSRFVKEKRLRPGDAVVFERLRPLDGGRAGECCRHFIGCRRKVASEKESPEGDLPQPEDEKEVENEAVEQQPAASSKRLRLFGVNLECGPDVGRRPSGFEFSGYGEYVRN